LARSEAWNKTLPERSFAAPRRPRKSAGNQRSGLGRGQDLGAGARDIGIGGLAARHQGKAALLDEVAAVPGARLVELGQLGGGIALCAEAIDADRGEGCYGGVVRGRRQGFVLAGIFMVRVLS